MYARIQVDPKSFERLRNILMNGGGAASAGGASISPAQRANSFAAEAIASGAFTPIAAGSTAGSSLGSTLSATDDITELGLFFRQAAGLTTSRAVAYATSLVGGHNVGSVKKLVLLRAKGRLLEVLTAAGVDADDSELVDAAVEAASSLNA